MKTPTKFKFVPAKPFIKFETEWGVFKQFPKEGAAGNSICYTTSLDAAWLVSIALNRFLNTDEGKKWLAKH